MSTAYRHSSSNWRDDVQLQASAAPGKGKGKGKRDPQKQIKFCNEMQLTMCYLSGLFKTLVDRWGQDGGLKSTEPVSDHGSICALKTSVTPALQPHAKSLVGPRQVGAVMS